MAGLGGYALRFADTEPSYFDSWSTGYGADARTAAHDVFGVTVVKGVNDHDYDKPAKAGAQIAIVDFLMDECGLIAAPGKDAYAEFMNYSESLNWSVISKDVTAEGGAVEFNWTAGTPKSHPDQQYDAAVWVVRDSQGNLVDTGTLYQLNNPAFPNRSGTAHIDLPDTLQGEKYTVSIAVIDVGKWVDGQNPDLTIGPIVHISDDMVFRGDIPMVDVYDRLTAVIVGEETYHFAGNNPMTVETEQGALTISPDGRYVFEPADGVDASDVLAEFGFTSVKGGDETATLYLGDYHQGSAGDDILDFSASTENTGLLGGEGWDEILGGSGDDVLHGGAGNDELSGGAGNDTIDGGSGNDLIEGGLGDDTLSGGAGNDYLDGGAGENMLFGGEGNDVMRYHAGDTIDGGEGLDFLLVADEKTDFGDLLSTGKVKDVEFMVQSESDAWSDLTKMGDIITALNDAGLQVSNEGQVTGYGTGSEWSASYNANEGNGYYTFTDKGASVTVTVSEEQVDAALQETIKSSTGS
jgi:Ca2+-binding RTX toxin-like protein